LVRSWYQVLSVGDLAGAGEQLLAPGVEGVGPHADDALQVEAVDLELGVRHQLGHPRLFDGEQLGPHEGRLLPVAGPQAEDPRQHALVQVDPRVLIVAQVGVEVQVLDARDEVLPGLDRLEQRLR